MLLLRVAVVGSHHVLAIDQQTLEYVLIGLELPLHYFFQKLITVLLLEKKNLLYKPVIGEGFGTGLLLVRIFFLVFLFWQLLKILIIGVNIIQKVELLCFYRTDHHFLIDYYLVLRSKN